jgi:hypothetical protein
VDVAGAVLEPEDVPGLGHVRDQRVVAGVLPRRGVDAAEGPADRGPGPDEGPLDVDRQAGQLQPRQGLGHAVPVGRDERGQRRLGDLPRPVGHRAARREARQATEARHQRLAPEGAPVLQAARPDVDPRQEPQGAPGAAMVTPGPGERLPQPGAQVDPAPITPEQFQAAGRRECPGHDLDREITLDPPPQGR